LEEQQQITKQKTHQTKNSLFFITTMSANNTKVGFIGSGMMAEALGGGLSNAGIVPWSNIYCTDPWQPRLDLFQSFGATACKDNCELAKNSDVIFIAVKPYGAAAVLNEISKELTKDKIVISICAGVTLETLEGAIIGRDVPVVRVMPNTPCLVGACAAAMARGKFVTDEQADLALKLMQSVGICVVVQEKLLDAVTGVSGSGPAYIYQVIEAMSDGGVLCGLPRDVSTKLAAQTVMGAAKMVLEKGTHPGQLKDNVTSPGGTTIAAVHELEKGGVRNSFINAVKAAAERSKELSKE
jgi:pyrroline-5-carboxylate reductase